MDASDQDLKKLCKNLSKMHELAMYNTLTKMSYDEMAKRQMELNAEAINNDEDPASHDLILMMMSSIFKNMNDEIEKIKQQNARLKQILKDNHIIILDLDEEN